MSVSEAINVSSALKYIANTSGIPIDTLKQLYFNNNDWKQNMILNINSAIAILRTLLSRGFKSSLPTISYSGSGQRACSVNTFKALYAKAMAGKSWNLVRGNTNLPYGKEIVLISPNNENANFRYINFTIYGGGGGGSGGARTNFDGNGTLTIQKGSDGGPTYLLKNKEIVATANGGSGGAGQVAQKSVRDGGNGTNGSSGGQSSYSGIFEIGDSFTIYPGYGGGGTGGGSLRAGKNSTYTGTVYTPVRGAGGNAGQWGNYDPRCAGGGGAGAVGYELQNNDFVLTTIDNVGGRGVNSGSTEAQNGSTAESITNCYFSAQRATSAKGGNGGQASSSVAGGAGGSGSSGGKAGISGSTNGYASGGGGGGSGWAIIDNPSSDMSNVIFNIL